jgi:hypothetical protein
LAHRLAIFCLINLLDWKVTIFLCQEKEDFKIFPPIFYAGGGGGGGITDGRHVLFSFSILSRLLLVRNLLLDLPFLSVSFF